MHDKVGVENRQRKEAAAAYQRIFTLVGPGIALNGHGAAMSDHGAASVDDLDRLISPTVHLINSFVNNKGRSPYQAVFGSSTSVP